jgi:tetratricopeptide (TPR) repeat protein
MSAKIPFTVLLLGLSLALVPATAENLVLDYFDGTVEVRTSATSWTPLDVGAVLAPDAVVRIKDNGLAELSAGSVKIHLGKDGTYQLSQSIAQSQKKGDNRVLGLTNKQVGMLLGVGNPAGLNVANMGARGAAKGSDEGLSWASDENAQTAAVADPADAVKAKMDEQDWSGALTLADAALKADPQDPQSLLFDKALILSQLGRAAASVRALQTADFRPGESHYLEASLLLGSLGLETEDYDLVLTRTAEALDTKPEKGAAQSLILSQALAWKAKGDAAKAKTLLNQVVKLEPQSAAGQEAARLLAL